MKSPGGFVPLISVGSASESKLVSLALLALGLASLAVLACYGWRWKG